MSYGNYITSPIPNTTLQELLINGVLKGYEVKAESGYLLHDKDLDVYDYDDEGNRTKLIETWFTGGGTSVRLDYDFTKITEGEYKYTDENGNEITMPVTMMGIREFYTVPAGVVPEKQKLGDSYEMEGDEIDN